jgi:multisubunit Na+/H+ antiporter MnhF subunit
MMKISLIGWRKFIAFLIACVFVWFGKISDDIWVIAFAVFVGGNVVAKYIPRGKE